jgi:hypothetical protein
MTDEPQDEQRNTLNDETTGVWSGSSATGAPVGGGTMAGTTEAATGGPTPKTPASADTGLTFGPGQSTSTGTLPTQGLNNLDGTLQGGTVGTDTAGGDEPPHGRLSDDLSDPETEQERRDRHDGTDRGDLDS